jgi:hypothetical protein
MAFPPELYAVFFCPSFNGFPLPALSKISIDGRRVSGSNIAFTVTASAMRWDLS